MHCSIVCLIFFLFPLTTQAQSFNLQAQHLSVGDSFIVDPPVFFEFDKASFLPECDMTLLDSVAQFIVAHENIDFEVRVHVDARASDMSSLRLDGARAKAVRAYLIQQGAPQDRLTARGMWKTEPIVSQKDIDKMESADEIEAAHAKNRRVELVAVGKG